ncbi:MAG: hypothetical protein QM762_07805 [Chryseolinea sp.]
MGQRTVFYLPANGQSLRDNLQTDYQDFREWILANNDASLKEFNERLISYELELFLREHETENLQEWNQRIIDEMVHEYFLTYCDVGPGDEKFTIVGPMMYTRHYDSSTQLITKSGDEDLIMIWNYLIQGRSIKNSNAFITPDADQVIGFWNYKERDFLNQRLLQFDKSMKGYEGIGYVLDVINEIGADKSDLILNVEKVTAVQ